jgi:IclR family acetate operon transcriptional repressor
MSAKPIQLLVNAMDVVNILAQHGTLSPAQIAELANIPRSSVYRLVEGLNEIGFTSTQEDSTVVLSKRWLHLADSARRSLREWEQAGPALAAVAQATGQTAFLTVPRGDEAVCIDWAPGRGIGVLVLKPGRSLPLYAGAGGRVLLAFGAEDRTEYLRGAPFPAFTPKSLVTAEALQEDINNTLMQGYAFSDEDVTPGIGALGVPVYGADEDLRGCLSIGGLAQDIEPRLDDHLGVLKQAAKQLRES